MIYNFLRNWSKGIFLAFFFFLHSTVFANDFYENFTIRSNDKRFQGITLRVSNNQITIATSNGIRYMSRNSVFASAKKRTDEVMNLDKVLDGIEHWLIRRNPQQVELEQLKANK